MPIMPPDKDAFLALLGNAMPGPLERGMELAKRGKVRIQNSLPDTVTARVQGTSEYRVMLGTTSGGVWSCTCPAAADGSFCKHCVATASIVGGLLNESPPSGSQGPGSERQRVETYVRSLDADALITIVIEQAEVDSGLEHRLLAAATAADGETIDVAEWKKKITAAFRGRGGHIEWRHAPEWARGVHDILDSLWSFLAAGFASEVATLVEHAHRRNESAVNRVDDSGGEIVNIMGVIAELHFAAAEAGAYRPKKLGTRLAEMELKADLDTFHRSAITYAEVLGDEGLDGYLKKLQKVAPNGLQGLPRYGEGFRLRHAFAAHAIATEDPDGLIDLLESNEFISASEYVELVRLLMTLGRVDDATEWADRGLEDEKAGGFDRSELRDLRAELMARTPGGAEAIEGLYWEEFERSGNVRTARDAITHAVDAVELRQRVLDSVGAAVDAFRQLPDRESNFRSRGASDAPIGSIGAQSHIFRARDAQFQGTDSVIAVLIELDEVDRAWAVAMEFGASARSWAGLVELRVDEHPRDALSWALVHAEMEIDHRDRRHYKRAVRVLREAQALATERTSVDDDLNGYLRGAIAELLAAHRNKPSLVDEFQKAGWA